MLEKRVFVSFFQMSIGSPVKQVSLRPCPPSTCTCQQNFEPGRSPLLRWALVFPNGKDVVMIRSGKHIGSPETPAVHDEEGMTHPSDSTAVGPGLRFSIWRSGVPCPFGPILLASLCSSACISVAQSLLFPALSSQMQPKTSLPRSDVPSRLDYNLMTGNSRTGLSTLMYSRSATIKNRITAHRTQKSRQRPLDREQGASRLRSRMLAVAKRCGVRSQPDRPPENSSVLDGR